MSAASFFLIKHYIEHRKVLERFLLLYQYKIDLFYLPDAGSLFKWSVWLIDLYQNSFDLDFLIKFHGHLFENLYKLIEIECHFACKVINEKYFYTLEDLFDGSKKHYYLYDCLNDFENKKIIQIKNTDFKIILWSFFRKNVFDSRN